jgi:hypothetical protein
VTRSLGTFAAVAALTTTCMGTVWAKTPLKPFSRHHPGFCPHEGHRGGQDYVLPVDSPDAEHAVASTTANAASFTRKTEGGKPLPVAFTCIKVEPR